MSGRLVERAERVPRAMEYRPERRDISLAAGVEYIAWGRDARGYTEIDSEIDGEPAGTRRLFAYSVSSPLAVAIFSDRHNTGINPLESAG